MMMMVMVMVMMVVLVTLMVSVMVMMMMMISHRPHGSSSHQKQLQQRGIAPPGRDLGRDTTGDHGIKAHGEVLSHGIQ
jgi:flagellar basal body-associated protein FliL